MGDDNELGREAPSSKVGYGGGGGFQPYSTDRSHANEFYEKVATPDDRGYLGHGANRKKGKEGSGYTNEGGQKSDAKAVGILNTAVHPDGAGDNHFGDRLSKEEENTGTDGTEDESLKSKLKEMLPGHHDHKHGDKGPPETRLPEMPIGNNEEDPGLFSKVKHKIVKSHEKHFDGLEPEAWG